MAQASNDNDVYDDHGVTETLKSLVMAFVLAMTFRGFVTEGFVIPTGSMAPTLMGQHTLVESDATGASFRVGMDPNQQSLNLQAVSDPMLGPDYPGWGTTVNDSRRRNGDRILVIKTLYPFFEPQRFDVVVFKNPTQPDGASANYIKRLVGLPNEKIWLADGDVFAGPAETLDELEDYRIQRKPEHVQRAVWQPVYHSDYVPTDSRRLDMRYDGPPWLGNGWTTQETRVYRCDTSEPTVLQWSNDIREIDDWTPYNQPRHPNWEGEAVSDVRIGAGVVADAAGLEMMLEMTTRGHRYEFSIADGQATVRMRPQDNSSDWRSESAPIDLPGPGRVFSVEFWHVDQSMSIFIDRERAVHLEYDWLPMERLKFASGLPPGEHVDRMLHFPIDPPEIAWHFRGSPVSLHRVRLDRDLHYRTAQMNGGNGNPPTSGYEDLVRSRTPGFGTHPSKPAVLGPDHFWMLGDNSARSLDGRIWGSPHPLVAEQIDPAPFVVNRKLLIGKAWVVYFPAMYPLTDNGRAFVPDFGRMRFIR